MARYTVSTHTCTCTCMHTHHMLRSASTKPRFVIIATYFCSQLVILAWDSHGGNKFVRNCRKRDEQIPHSILVLHELNYAEEFRCRTIKSLAFLKDITDLRMKGTLRLTSNRLTFHPFLDPKGLLRVGGRISQANLPYTK